MLLSEAALILLGQRMLGGAVTWGSWYVGLGLADLAALTPDSVLADLQELAVGDNPGYARAAASLANNDEDADGPDMRLSLTAPAFTNTGEANWQTVKNIFVVAVNGGTTVWVYAQSVSDLTLVADEQFTPSTYVDDDATVVIAGRATNRGEPATAS
jgi:hypothetical protein